MKHTFKLYLAVSAALALPLSCTMRETDAPDTGRHVPDSEAATVSLSFSGLGSPSATKTSTLDGAETVHSGATVYAFEHSTGLLDSYYDVPSTAVEAPGHSPSGSGVTMRLTAGKTYDFVVVGNLWAIDRSSGEKKDLMTALGVNCPSTLSELRSLSYVFGASTISATSTAYRPETFAEVATYGIPYKGLAENKSVVNGGTVTIDCSYAFARLHVTVDHTAFDGAEADKVGFFRNMDLLVSGGNALMHPFGTAAEKLTSASYRMGVADNDPSPSNGNAVEFDLYVPENCHGDLLPSNSDPHAKTYDALSSYSLRDCLTYIEFRGEVNPDNAYASRIGYGGTYLYRFYLGTDNVKNFDVTGGRRYDIDLTFTISSLFEPCAEWMVDDGGTFTDTRLFSACEDADGQTLIAESRTVAVRSNRAASFWLYLNKEGKKVSEGGSNQLSGVASSNAGFVPADLEDCSWYLESVTCAGDDILADSASNGITPSFDGNKVTLTVTNADAFAGYRDYYDLYGDSYALKYTFRLLPSKAGEQRAVVTVHPYADIAFEVDKPLNSDYYVGMKRTVTCAGLAGTNVEVWNGESGCTAQSVKIVQGSAREWVGGEDNKIAVTGTSFGVAAYRETYAYSKNPTAASKADNLSRVTTPTRACTLHVTSDDPFNDGEGLTLPVSVQRTWVKTEGPNGGQARGNYSCYVDGNGTEVDQLCYKSASMYKAADWVTEAGFHELGPWKPGDEADGYGWVFSSPIDYSAFDPVTYEELLRPVYTVADNNAVEARATLLSASDLSRSEFYVYKVKSAYSSTSAYSCEISYTTPYARDIASSTCEPAACYSGVITMTVPKLDAYDSHSNAYRKSNPLRLDDYSTLPSESGDYRASTSGTIDSEFSFGVSSASNLKFEIVPQMEGSLSNGACSASISGLDGGTVTVTIAGRNYSHSVGYHNLLAYAVNTRSNTKIYSSYRGVVKITLHLCVGGLLGTHYSSTTGGNIPTEVWQVKSAFYGSSVLSGYASNMGSSGVTVTSASGWESPSGGPTHGGFYRWESRVVNQVANPGSGALREDAFAQDSLNFTNPSLAQIKSSSWIEATYTPRITLCEYPSMSEISGEAPIGSMEDTVTAAGAPTRPKYLKVRCYNDWAD